MRSGAKVAGGGVEKGSAGWEDGEELAVKVEIRGDDGEYWLEGSSIFITRNPI